MPQHAIVLRLQNESRPTITPHFAAIDCHYDFRSWIANKTDFTNAIQMILSDLYSILKNAVHIMHKKIVSAYNKQNINLLLR